jgi:hypothetical protein
VLFFCIGLLRLVSHKRSNHTGWVPRPPSHSGVFHIRHNRGVGAFFEMPYANEKGAGRRNPNQASSKKLFEGLFGDKWDGVTVCFTFVEHRIYYGLLPSPYDSAEKHRRP